MAAKTVMLLLASTLALPVNAVAPTKPGAMRKAARPAVKTAANTPAAVVAPLADTPEIAGLRAAYRFAVPVYAMMLARHRELEPVAASGPGVNHLYPVTTLGDAGAGGATLPDDDVLVASAWFDLAGGPVILDMPALPGRYHSVALVDLFTDTLAVLGTRTGGAGGRVVIAGPAWIGDVPKGATLLRSTTSDARLLVRVRVDGPADRAAATGLLRSFTLEVPPDNLAPVATVAVPTAVPDAATLIAVVDEALARARLSPALASRAAHPELGISVQAIDPAAVASETLALWQASLPALRTELAGADDLVDGWVIPSPDVATAASDDTVRARVALTALGTLPTSEAVTLAAAVDRDGAALSGASAYTVRVPNLPPGSFWSLSIYRRASDGGWSLADTPTRRAVVGDRSRDLRPERDGHTDIFVQVAPPTGERVVNWLPAPAGAFRLAFRAYRPAPGVLDGSLRPAVEATAAIP